MFFATDKKAYRRVAKWLLTLSTPARYELAIVTTEGDWILRGDRIRWVLRRPGQSAILRSSFFKIGVIRDSQGKLIKVVASGAGNGHGIGLCQWGAMGMARSGKGYREILSHYYEDTRLETL